MAVAHNLVNIVKLLLAMDGMSSDCTRVPKSDHQFTENIKASVLDELSEASTPMVYIAAFYGSAEALDVLLNAGADVNKVGGPRFTVLQIASLGGHTDIVKNMLRKGLILSSWRRAGKRTEGYSRRSKVRDCRDFNRRWR